jgi:hypothetical protein
MALFEPWRPTPSPYSFVVYHIEAMYEEALMCSPESEAAGGIKPYLDLAALLSTPILPPDLEKPITPPLPAPLHRSPLW